MTAPRPRAVVIGSLSLFVVLFVVLTFELSAGASSPTANGPRSAKARPAEVKLEAAGGPEEPAARSAEAVEPAYVEPEEPAAGYGAAGAGYVEPEPGYVEPGYGYVEPEVEEAPPVVTTSS